jgi:hypothetical protein
MTTITPASDDDDRFAAEVRIARIEARPAQQARVERMFGRIAPCAERLVVAAHGEPEAFLSSVLADELLLANLVACGCDAEEWHTLRPWLTACGVSPGDLHALWRHIRRLRGEEVAG